LHGSLAARVDLFRDLGRHFRSIVKFPEEATYSLADEQYVRNFGTSYSAPPADLPPKAGDEEPDAAGSTPGSPAPMLNPEST
jgi:hypothetical protein